MMADGITLGASNPIVFFDLTLGGKSSLTTHAIAINSENHCLSLLSFHTSEL